MDPKEQDPSCKDSEIGPPNYRNSCSAQEQQAGPGPLSTPPSQVEAQTSRRAAAATPRGSTRSGAELHHGGSPRGDARYY